MCRLAHIDVVTNGPLQGSWLQLLSSLTAMPYAVRGGLQGGPLFRSILLNPSEMCINAWGGLGGFRKCGFWEVSGASDQLNSRSCQSEAPITTLR